MRLTQLEPVRENNTLVGWTARFTDDGGQVRIANLGIGCLLDPIAFAQAASRQGVRYESPHETDQAAWKILLRNLTVWPSRKAG